MNKASTSKHRCQCFSEESSSFLYGLRREGPSTERVVLERLLNVLSRAAAKSSKNPQRLWSEKPDWWRECTDLPWKNPREHPKDKKETLKKKIEILERELRKRGLMSQAIEEALELSKNGKKADLELKSDFEAVIAKASGLHYMVNQVCAKMEKTTAFSDKIALYIGEIKTCLEKSLNSLNTLYQRVESREKRKQSLWDKMGVSKSKKIRSTSDEMAYIEGLADPTAWLAGFSLFCDEKPPILSPVSALDSLFHESASVEALSPPPFSVIPKVSRPLQRSASEPSPVPAFTMVSRPLQLKSESVTTLAPFVLETVDASGIARSAQANRPADVSVVRPTVNRQCASQTLPSLGSVAEYMHEDMEPATDISSRRKIFYRFSPPDTVIGGVRPQGITMTDNLSEIVEVRKHGSHRRSGRSKSLGGGLFSSGLEVRSAPAETVGKPVPPQSIYVPPLIDLTLPDSEETAPEVSSTSPFSVNTKAADSSQGLVIEVAEGGEGRNFIEGPLAIDGMQVIEITEIPAEQSYVLLSGGMQEASSNDFRYMSATDATGEFTTEIGEEESVSQLETSMSHAFSLDDIRPSVTDVIVSELSGDGRTRSSRSPHQRPSRRTVPSMSDVITVGLPGGGTSIISRSPESPSHRMGEDEWKTFQTKNSERRRSSSSDSLSAAIGKFGGVF